ncbi:unnamed protein product [Leptidea sinapis]|uniref:Uncharacterized protein n=1 Tax=Leptidea sinapis TaxID=189913 RepID=A0A5E4PPT9_9NEOP|nr:unnamed protein product [Leptidea sinapis]
MYDVGVCARRRAASREERSCPGSRTRRRLQQAWAEFADSVSIPEDVGIETGGPGETPRSSIHCGAADSHWAFESSLVNFVPCTVTGVNRDGNSVDCRSYKSMESMPSIMIVLCPRARQRGGVHRASVADRRGDRGSRVLAVRQLLVSGARGRAGGRLTRVGGRLHPRVAPALRAPQGEPLGRGLAVSSAAAPCPAAPGASLHPRGQASLYRRGRLPPTPM